MAKMDFPLSEVYGLLETGPVVLITSHVNGKRDVMAQSWHTMVEFEPAIVACVVSDRNFSHELILESGECVLNIPTFEIAEKVVGCGNASGRDLDKFAKFGLAVSPASLVGAPLLDECYASLECRVFDRIPAYELFLLQVVKAWVDPDVADPKTLHHRGFGAFMIAGETARFPSAMK
ncbi:MAG: flavin reductase family protein [Burkholderiales bacterium]|nr:flavin reductase family protein [Burkholderiales bacterium]